MKGKRALHGGQAVDQRRSLQDQLKPFDAGTTAGDFAAHLRDMEAVVAELVKSGLLKPE